MPLLPAAPLVSVIIPCYNYAHFLPEALNSVLQQTHPVTEILVIDDGSTDNTREIVARYPGVVYIYQDNQGLAAARNTGIEKSTGVYLTFLDADDWLFPDALAINVRFLQQAPQAAFSAGGHTFVYDDGRRVEVTPGYSANPYLDLLARGNYIAMIAAVMFTRWVAADFTFDPSLANCEDYDLYLRITKRHPIVQHQAQLAAYRIHGAAMSAHVPSMLAGALEVLARQRKTLESRSETAAYRRGVRFWNRYYSNELRMKRSADAAPSYPATMAFFLKQAPSAGIHYGLIRLAPMMKATLKRLLPAPALRGLRYLGLVGPPLPPVGSVVSGDFNRLTPFSTCFGYDRGGPIDRYYIEGFLQNQATTIHGRVLEIGDNAYTLQFGGNKVTQSDVLHIDATNPRATFIGDLSDAPQLPDNAFDCIILTQTLHLIYDFRGALATCYRILKPGGTLLLTVPGITPIDQGEWRDTWYWSFTDKALHRLTAELYAGAKVEIQSFGNVCVATAYLYGMGLPEISLDKLTYYDPQFQVINAVKVVK